MTRPSVQATTFAHSRPRVWYHGRTARDPAWQHDPDHPGIWLASRRAAARWYAGPNGEVLTVTLQLGAALLDLRDRATLNDLIRRAHLNGHAVRRWHRRGQLYLLEEGDAQNRLVRQAFLQRHALLMRDDTAGLRHLSLAVQHGDDLQVLHTARQE